MNLRDPKTLEGFLAGLAVGLIAALAVGALGYVVGAGNRRGIVVANTSPSAGQSRSPAGVQTVPSSVPASPTGVQASPTSVPASPTPGSCSVAGPASTASSDSQPAARAYAAMAFDWARHKLVMFGGVGPGGFLQDTWTWDGTAWTQISPAHVPPPRQMAGLVWDTKRQVLVLFGGIGPGGVALSDTWQWNGKDWTQSNPAHCPSPRAPSAIAYDEAAGKVVVFGVRSSSDNVVDTWRWDGTDWTQVAGPSPEANVSYSPTIGMAWDPVTHAVTLVDFRSKISLGVHYWRLGANGWGPMNSVQLGTWGDQNLAAYDPGRNLWMFYGDQSAMVSFGVVVFDGAGLHGSSPSPHPTAEGDSVSSTYDGDLKEIVAFGGNSRTGVTAEFWAWDFQRWTKLSV